MESSPGGTQPARKKPFKVPVIFAPIYIPLLFLAGALSIPWTYIQKSEQRRRERRFAEQMKKAGRLMQWQEFKQAEANGTGTANGEYHSMKGPFRLWWSPDDIRATSPHKWKRDQPVAWMEPEFLPFFQWCYARYTNPEAGLAQLVSVPEEERNQLKEMLTSSRFVSTCSFRSLRESHSAKSPG
jgi:hypothetical protein